jgi:hypothetical protein
MVSVGSDRLECFSKAMLMVMSTVITLCRTIMINPIRCHFSFPATVNGKSVRLKVVEEMAESIFNIQVPVEVL